MAASCIAPPEVEPPVEEKIKRVRQPEPVGPRRPLRDLLVKIFEGHQEFLGCTPD